MSVISRSLGNLEKDVAKVRPCVVRGITSFVDRRNVQSVICWDQRFTWVLGCDVEFMVQSSCWFKTSVLCFD